MNRPSLPGIASSALETAGLAHLYQLVILRAILIMALIGACLSLLYLGELSLERVPLPALIAPIIALTLFNLYSYWQIKQRKPIHQMELFFQLLGDILVLSVALYYTGGSTNPFVSYYLVPVTLSAAALPAFYTGILILFAALIYYVQLQHFVPFALFSNPHNHHAHHNASNAHFTGMWINFLFSACLIGYFLQRMQHNINLKNQALRETETQLHRNEQLFALGTLAAGTAHQLGTPLNTMLLLVQDLEQDENLPGSARDDLYIVRSQIEACKQILQNLKQTEASLAPSHVTVADYLSELTGSINIVRPDKLVSLQEKNGPPMTIKRDIALDQAIMNLLNNALDESADGNISVSWNRENDKACIKIQQTKGASSSPPPQPIGVKPYTTKPEGLGIGIMLTLSSLERWGGSAQFSEDEHFIITRISLPLEHDTIFNY